MAPGGRIIKLSIEQNTKKQHINFHHQRNWTLHNKNASFLVETQPQPPQQHLYDSTQNNRESSTGITQGLIKYGSVHVDATLMQGVWYQQ